jgi:hypothetical protein
MDNRKLTALARQLAGQSLASIDQELRQRHLDVTECIAVKHAIDAAAVPLGRTVHATSHQEARPRNEMDRLLDRIGVDAKRQYTEAELTGLLQQTDLDAQSRIAVRLECRARGLTRDTSEADRLLRNLGIEGPVSLEAIEQQMDRVGWGVTAKNVVKSELQVRGWLKSPGNRSMRAAADPRPTRLVDRRGHPLTLKSQPE